MQQEQRLLKQIGMGPWQDWLVIADFYEHRAQGDDLIRAAGWRWLAANKRFPLREAGRYGWGRCRQHEPIFDDGNAPRLPSYVIKIIHEKLKPEIGSSTGFTKKLEHLLYITAEAVGEWLQYLEVESQKKREEDEEDIGK